MSPHTFKLAISAALLADVSCWASRAELAARARCSASAAAALAPSTWAVSVATCCCASSTCFRASSSASVNTCCSMAANSSRSAFSTAAACMHALKLATSDATASRSMAMVLRSTWSHEEVST